MGSKEICKIGLSRRDDFLSGLLCRLCHYFGAKGTWPILIAMLKKLDCQISSAMTRLVSLHHAHGRISLSQRVIITIRIQTEAKE